MFEVGSLVSTRQGKARRFALLPNVPSYIRIVVAPSSRHLPRSYLKLERAYVLPSDNLSILDCTKLSDMRHLCKPAPGSSFARVRDLA